MRTPVRLPSERQQFRASEILLEDGQPLGPQLDPWQVEDFLALDDPAHRHAYLERPRGHSKTGDLGTEAVCEMVLGPAGRQLYAAATDEDQAGLLLQDVVGKFQRNPRLASLITVKRNQVVMKRGKTTLTILASDAPSSYGLRPDWLALDEVAEWRNRALWDSLWSASGKRRHCRVLVISTAGWNKASIAWEVRQIAASEPNWYLSSRGQCASWVDAAWLAQQRRTLPAHVFARLHENRWVDGVGAFFSSEEIERIFVDQPPMAPGVRMIGLDLGLSRDRTVIALLRVDGGTGLVVIDALLTYVPPIGAKVDLQEVESAVADLSRTWGAPIVADSWQAALMLQRLRGQGLPCVEVTFTADSRRKLFGSLLDLVRTNQLRSRPHPDLRRELLGLDVQQTSGGGWRVDHRTGQHDDHVVAVALALGGFWDETVAQHAADLETLDANDQAIQAQVAAYWHDDPLRLHPDYVGPEEDW